MADNRPWRQTPEGQWQYQGEDGNWYVGTPSAPAAPRPAATSPAAPVPAKRGRRPGCLFVIILAVIGAVVGGIIAASSSGGSYSASLIGITAVSSSTLAVDLRITNNGGSPGTPSCSITANSPGDADTGVDVVSPTKPIRAHTTIFFVDDVTITNNGATNVRQSGVSVSC